MDTLMNSTYDDIVANFGSNTGIPAIGDYFIVLNRSYTITPQIDNSTLNLTHRESLAEAILYQRINPQSEPSESIIGHPVAKYWEGAFTPPQHCNLGTDASFSESDFSKSPIDLLAETDEWIRGSSELSDR